MNGPADGEKQLTVVQILEFLCRCPIAKGSWNSKDIDSASHLQTVAPHERPLPDHLTTERGRLYGNFPPFEWRMPSSIGAQPVKFISRLPGIACRGILHMKV
jgi:hypothetical protein